MYTKNRNKAIDQKLNVKLNEVKQLDMTQIHSKVKSKSYIKNLQDRSHSTNIDSRRDTSFYNPIKGLMQTFKNKQDNEMISKNQTMIDA